MKVYQMCDVSNSLSGLNVETLRWPADYWEGSFLVVIVQRSYPSVLA